MSVPVIHLYSFNNARIFLSGEVLDIFSDQMLKILHGKRGFLSVTNVDLVALFLDTRGVSVFAF